jgi:hypothetical protein
MGLVGEYFRKRCNFKVGGIDYYAPFFNCDKCGWYEIQGSSNKLSDQMKTFIIYALIPLFRLKKILLLDFDLRIWIIYRWLPKYVKF